MSTLDAARSAYEKGDIGYAIEELNFALQLLQQQNAGSLANFQPEPLEGWTRTIDDEAGRALGIMGGSGTVAEYTNGDAAFTIQIVVDSPIIAGAAALFGNAGLMASMGTVVHVGREKFIIQDEELIAVIGNRILIQASGIDDTDIMIDHLKAIDFNSLKTF